jgi:hypothetical protein
VASTAETVTVLPAGIPLYLSAELGVPALFRYLHQPPPDQPAAALQMSLVALSGNPDLCVSRNGSALAAAVPRVGRSDRVQDRQAAMDATAAIRASISQLCTWYRVAQGSGSLTIPFADPRGGDGWYYAAVFSSDASFRFILTSRVMDTTPLPVTPDLPFSAAAPAGGCAYFQLQLDPGHIGVVASVRLLLSAPLGRPGIFVRLVLPGVVAPLRPTRNDFDFVMLAPEWLQDPLTLNRAHLGEAVAMIIGVSDLDSYTAFTLIAIVERARCDGSGADADLCPDGEAGHIEPVLRLQAGRQTIWSTVGDEASYARFGYAAGSLPWPIDVTLTLLPVPGELYGHTPPWRRPKLVASFFGAWPTVNRHAFPRPGDYAASERRSELRDETDQTYHLQSAKRCRAESAPLGTFTELLQCVTACRDHLRPSGASGCFYFSYGLQGQCEAFYAADASCPEGWYDDVNPQERWSFYTLTPPLTAASSLRLSPVEAAPDFCVLSAGGCVLHVAMLCDLPPCTYGIMAALVDAVVQLQSGVPQRGLRTPFEWAYYSVRIPAGALGLAVECDRDVGYGDVFVCVVEIRSPDDPASRVPGDCAVARPAVEPPAPVESVRQYLLRLKSNAVDPSTVWMLDGNSRLAEFWHACHGCEVVLAVGSIHEGSPFASVADFRITATVLWSITPLTAGGVAGAALLVLFLLAATAVTAFVCRRRYTRGQALLPGFVKNQAAYLPSMPRFPRWHARLQQLRQQARRRPGADGSHRSVTCGRRPSRDADAGWGAGAPLLRRPPCLVGGWRVPRTAFGASELASAGGHHARPRHRHSLHGPHARRELGRVHAELDGTSHPRRPAETRPRRAAWPTTLEIRCLVA